MLLLTPRRQTPFLAFLWMLVPALLAGMQTASADAEPVTSRTPERIISSDAGATDILLALGLDDRIVGIDDSSQHLLLKQRPRLGYHRALAAEGIITLAPDLVIGSTQMGPPHVLDNLQRSQIPVLQLEPALSAGGLRTNITALVNAVSAVNSDSAANLLLTLDNKVAALDDLSLKNGNHSGTPTAAFLLRAEAGKLRMAGTDTAGHAFIELTGARNLANYSGYRSLSAEGLLAEQPDILLFADTAGMDVETLLRDFPVLRFSTAHMQQRLIMVDPNTLVAGLSLGALDEAIRVLHMINPKD